MVHVHEPNKNKQKWTEDTGVKDHCFCAMGCGGASDYEPKL